MCLEGGPCSWKEKLLSFRCIYTSEITPVKICIWISWKHDWCENHERFLLLCFGCFLHFWTSLSSLHARAYYFYAVPQAANSNTLTVLLEMNKALQPWLRHGWSDAEEPTLSCYFPVGPLRTIPVESQDSLLRPLPALLLHYCYTCRLIPDLINVTGLKCISVPLE